MIINFDNVIEENTITHNLNWSYVPVNPYRILITGGSGSGKRNTLFSLIHHQKNDDIIDKIIYMLRIHMNQNINS